VDRNGDVRYTSTHWQGQILSEDGSRTIGGKVRRVRVKLGERRVAFYRQDAIVRQNRSDQRSESGSVLLLGQTTRLSWLGQFFIFLFLWLP
jgi:hypothetical protein